MNRRNFLRRAVVAIPALVGMGAVGAEAVGREPVVFKAHWGKEQFDAAMAELRRRHMPDWRTEAEFHLQHYARCYGISIKALRQAVDPLPVLMSREDIEAMGQLTVGNVRRRDDIVPEDVAMREAEFRRRGRHYWKDPEDCGPDEAQSAFG